DTCNGWHGGETITRFTHMELVVPWTGTTSTTLPGCVSTTSWTVKLSEFLTGIDVPQPPDAPASPPPPTQHYDDLERRQEVLAGLTTGTCVPFFFFFHPLNMIH